MMDEQNIKNAEIGTNVIKFAGCEATYGRIIKFSPTRAHLTVRWETGRTTKLHHSRYASITLVDHRERKQKPDP